MNEKIRELRRFIRGNITEKDFFLSGVYQKHMQNLADIISRQYNDTIKVRLVWHEDDETASTDNRNININLACHEIQHMGLGQEEKHNSYVGLLAHELGHVLYTDFRLLNAIYIENKWLPKVSDELKKDCHWWNEVEQAHQKKFMQFSKLLAEISNIIEDKYIENEFVKFYSGDFKKDIDFLNDEIFTFKDIPEDNIFNCVLKQVFCKKLSQKTLSEKPLFCTTLSLVSKICDAHEPGERMNLSYELIVRVWEYLLEYFPDENSLNNKDKAGDDNSDSGERKMEDDIKNSSRTSTQGSGNQAPMRSQQQDANSCANKGEDEKCKLSQSENKVQNSQSYGQGDTYLKTEQSENNSEFSCLYSRILDEFINEQLSDAKKRDDIQKRLNESLAEKAKNSNFHYDRQFEITTPQTANEDYDCRAATLFSDAVRISKRLQEKVKRSIIEKERGTRINNLPVGRRIDNRALARKDNKIFSRSILPNKQPALSFAVVLDESGSMRADDRIDRTRFAALVLEDFCRNLHIPLFMIGHTESSGKVKLIEYVNFEDKNSKGNRNKLLTVRARANNRDGFALRYAIEKISRRAEKTKVVIVISDGIPNAVDYDFAKGKADIKSCVQRAKKKKTIVVAMAIGDDEKGLYDIYKDDLIVVKDLNTLPQKLVSQITKRL